MKADDEKITIVHEYFRSLRLKVGREEIKEKQPEAAFKYSEL